MSIDMPALKSIRIFISYSSKDKKTVGSLKDSLEKIGFEVFLAHEDIKPSSEWQTEIVRNLKKCDIFIPFLSKKFKTSKWTDQEIGMAFVEGKFVIPLQVDRPPYGFIEKYQSQKLCKSKGELDFDETAKEITKIIVNAKRFKNDMKEFVISNLLNSQHWHEAKARVIFLEYFDTFSVKEVNRIVDGAIKNFEIHAEFTSERVLKRFIDKYQKVIKPRENYKKLKNLLERRF
jgi:hypothetical protein